MIEKNETCALYVRSATADGSLYEQEFECHRYAQLKGWTIPDHGVLTDEDTSGNTMAGRVVSQFARAAISSRFQTWLAIPALSPG
jgi:hypothetical protein